MSSSPSLPISAFGEKRLITEFIRPLFNREDKPGGVGDDCAMLRADAGGLGAGDWLFSTDRVPADLTAFRLGILDHYGLGRYLACLNLSDIAACGGRPLALLLNLGLPSEFPYDHFTSLCRGFGETAGRYGAEVLGGDMTWSRDVSISATSIGRAVPGGPLTRRARPGDTVFVSKPPGLTPAAFAYHLCGGRDKMRLTDADVDMLNRQFTQVEPEVKLGLELSASACCTACMDNTDGVGQSLSELAAASEVMIVVESAALHLPRLVTTVADSLHQDRLHLAFGAGADFALVGTLRGRWNADEVKKRFGPLVTVMGRVEAGRGVQAQVGQQLSELKYVGWNYFT